MKKFKNVLFSLFFIVIGVFGVYITTFCVINYISNNTCVPSIWVAGACLVDMMIFYFVIDSIRLINGGKDEEK